MAIVTMRYINYKSLSRDMWQSDVCHCTWDLNEESWSWSWRQTPRLQGHDPEGWALLSLHVPGTVVSGNLLRNQYSSRSHIFFFSKSATDSIASGLKWTKMEHSLLISLPLVQSCSTVLINLRGSPACSFRVRKTPVSSISDALHDRIPRINANMVDRCNIWKFCGIWKLTEWSEIGCSPPGLSMEDFMCRLKGTVHREQLLKGLGWE